MKKRITGMLALAIILAMPASAGVNRILDGTAITVGSPSNLLTLPQTTDTAVARATTDTLTNKTISGATNTLSNISAGSSLTGQVPVANGGTGAATLGSNGLVYGNGTSAVGVTAAGSQYQVFQAGSGGTPTAGAVQLNQSAAVSGTLPVANGGTGQSSLTAHDVLVGNGTGGITQVSPSTSGLVLTSNGVGSDPSFQPVASAAPALNGGSASAQSVTAAGGITLSGITYENYVWIVGSPAAVTVTATPSITACTADGQRLIVRGTSATNTVTLQDNAGLAGSNLQLNGTWVGGLYSSLTLSCNITLGMWVEESRR